MTRALRLPIPAPAEVAAAAAIVRRHLEAVLREDRNRGSRKSLTEPEYHRALHAFRVMEALERPSKSVEA